MAADSIRPTTSCYEISKRIRHSAEILSFCREQMTLDVYVRKVILNPSVKVRKSALAPTFMQRGCSLAEPKCGDSTWGIKQKKKRVVYLVSARLSLHGTPARVRPTDVSPICVFVHTLADLSVLHVHNKVAEHKLVHEVVEMRCKRPRECHMVSRHMLSRFQIRR